MKIQPSPLNNASRSRSDLAIVGFGDGAEEAPWDDPDVDIWGCNSWPFAKRPRQIFLDAGGRFRADLWWQIHPDWTINDGERLMLEYSTPLDLPVVVLPGGFSAPNVIPLDFHVLRAQFPLAPFASSFCYMYAEGIRRGYKRIRVYGADCLSIGRELVYERPANLYWQAVAHERGIVCTFERPSTLGSYPYAYGVDYEREAMHGATITDRVLGGVVTADGENLDTVAQVRAFVASNHPRKDS